MFFHYFYVVIFLLYFIFFNFYRFNTPSKIYNYMKNNNFCPDLKIEDTKFNYNVLFLLFELICI